MQHIVRYPRPCPTCLGGSIPNCPDCYAKSTEGKLAELIAVTEEDYKRDRSFANFGGMSLGSHLQCF